MVLLLPLLMGLLSAQSTAQSERVVRIEENTHSLKSTIEKVDKTLEAMQRDLRALQDRVIAVEAQNKIILSIATVAFTLGLTFLVWLWKKFEAVARQNFTPEDRELLSRIYQKIPDRTTAAGSPQ